MPKRSQKVKLACLGKRKPGVHCVARFQFRVEFQQEDGSNVYS